MAGQVMLAIETSQRYGSVALRDPSGSILEEPLLQAKRHDDDLLPAIDRLFTRCGLTPRDLATVAVSIGPGGFTGLRIAVTTAKMFGETLGAKIVAVPSALVAAESCGEHHGTLAVALSSKRSSFWLTIVTRSGVDDSWAIRGQPGICESERLELTGFRTMLADEYLPDVARQRCEQAGLPILEPRFAATACLGVGMRLLAAGKTTDPLALAPVYPRPPEAVALWDARQDGPPKA